MKSAVIPNEVIYLIIIIALFGVNIVNNWLDGKSDKKKKYVAYKDDYQKDLEQQRKDKDAASKRQAEDTRAKQAKKQQKNAADLYEYTEMCRLVKKKVNELPERIRREAEYFFNMNSERVLAYMVKNNMYNPRFETPKQVLIFGAMKMMADELKARQANGEWNPYTRQYEGSRGNTQQKTANEYFQDQERRQQKRREDEQKQRQQVRTAPKGKADYCAVLGLNLTHSKEELKRAYRTKAKLYHADLQQNKTAKEKAHAEVMSREVNAAHDYLITYFPKGA